MPSAIQIHPLDNVAVVLRSVGKGDRLEVGGQTVEARDDIPFGHKIALADMPAGREIVKYGHTIGRATVRIAAGDWTHSHNVGTTLEGIGEYQYEPTEAIDPDASSDGKPDGLCFSGYRRTSGRVGTRNEVWIVNTVGCVNRSAERIAQVARTRFGDMVEGVHSFSHPYGCSQLGDDLEHTQRVLGGLIRHPNAGGVLVLGLGCENNRLERLLEVAGEADRSRIRYFESQFVEDEVESGVEAVAELVKIMSDDRRTECPLSDLTIGMKCGGSDSLSGLTANPLVGRIADRMVDAGATVLLTEVPEMFGAEQQLMNRAANEQVFDSVVGLINDFKAYFIRHCQPIYENPSPGNIEGGITTLEEKSLGAVQKGGRRPVSQVLQYGQLASKPGLGLIYGPGNDAVSVTAEIASGAALVLFTTGRGTPLGFPVPTLKISSNTDIFGRKPTWIDFNAGALVEGSRDIEELTDELMDHILQIASGRQRTLNEINDYREIAIWKDGVTL